MVYRNEKENDQIADRSGQSGPARRKNRIRQLSFPIFPLRLHSTTAICDISLASVPKNRLSP